MLHNDLGYKQTHAVHNQTQPKKTTGIGRAVAPLNIIRVGLHCRHQLGTHTAVA